MALPLSSTYIAAKNRLEDANSWHVLIKIVFGPDPDQTMFLCDGNVDIVWNSNTWVAFPFAIEAIKEGGKSEVQRVTARVSNITKAVQYHVEQQGGGMGSAVTIYTICTSDLTEITNVPSFDFEVVGCTFTDEWVTFSLGGTSPYRKADPAYRMHKNWCRFDFKDGRCPYVGTLYTSCNGTISDCVDRNGDDSKFIGTFPMIGENTLYV